MKAENGGLYEHLSGLSKAELMDRASALVRHTSVETAIPPGLACPCCHLLALPLSVTHTLINGCTSLQEIEGRSKAKNKDDLVKLIFDFESVAFRKHDVAKYFAETFTSEGLRKILVAYGVKGAPTTLDERAWYIGLYLSLIHI